MFLRRNPKYFKLKYLLVFPPIISISFVVYFFINKSPNIPNTIPKITRLNKTVVTHSAITCIPFTVPDNRSFFEREPPQFNLPRRISYSSDEALFQYLRSLRLIVVACARNVEKQIDKFRSHIEPIVDLFDPSSSILICENDSRDKTLQKLRQWSRAQVYSYGDLSRLLIQRTDRLAFCRNILLNKAQELKADYILSADLDIFKSTISSFLSNFRYNTDDWSVMTASTNNSYYDIWVLRTLSDSNLNFDCWHLLWDLLKSDKNYCYQSLYNQIMGNNEKGIPIDHGLIEMRSAFGGAGLYKVNATYGCEYSGANITCEHVPFHLCMREKNQARIFINPEFLVR
jgi:hypothetical protein